VLHYLSIGRFEPQVEKEDVSSYFLDAAAALADFEEEDGNEDVLDEDMQVEISPEAEANVDEQYESSVDEDEVNDEESEEELLDV